ncbi:proline-, glutamic acid- and leucine-rich protein 1 [Menidia menidia]
MATSGWLHGTSAMRLTEGLVLVLKEQRPEYLPDVLAKYREHGVFPTQGASDVAGLVGYTNAKLSSSKTRFEGLCTLSLLVKDSSSDLFQVHCLSWLRFLQQVIQSQAPLQTIQLAVNILKDVLQYSHQQPQLAREVGLNSILGILTSLLGLKMECELAAMEGMIACMVYYPRACGSLRDKLGAYFLSKMDNTNKKIQEMACQCYSHLPCMGGMLDRPMSVGRANGWNNQIHCLLASANALLAQIYQGSEAAGALQYQGPGVELAFPHLDEADPLYVLQLQHRYSAVCKTIKHTLRVDPFSAVHLPVRPILNLVCRALAVSRKSLNLSTDGSLRLLVLPSVHTSTFEVLSDVITVVRSGMVQYAAVIHKLFSQTLSAWTSPSETNVGKQKAYSSVRESVYRALELWVRVVGASANILQGSHGHAQLLFSHLLADITPEAESARLRAGLSVDVVPGGKPGPRRTKQLVIADGGEQSLQRKGDFFPNQDTCLSALRALRQIIQTSGTLLKEDIHKRLHEVVLPLCVRLQQQQSVSSPAHESTRGISGQYSSAITRRELYRLLLALVLVPSPFCPPPSSCAVSIFSNGRVDRNIKVSSFCAKALTICNSVLHSRIPSIGLPLPPLTPKSSGTASVLSSQGPASRLTLSTLLEGSLPGPAFPTRHSLSLGPSSLLDSLENHLSLVPGLPGQAPPPGDLILSQHSHHQPDVSGLGPPEGQRPVFVRYDKEEAEDVEISLASDSDDSVVIVPPGMLNVENQQVDPSTNPQNMLPTLPDGTGITLTNDSVTMVPTTAATTAIDVSSLPNTMTTSSPLITTSTAPNNSLPPSSTSVVSLVPPLNSGTISAPPGGLGDQLPCKAQLQQMLMQSPTAGPPNPMGLPLQMHQLTQQGRHLNQHAPAPASEESAVININSSDEEDDEEDLEDDEELEEEGIDEDEEEEGSDEFYDGEEYDDFDEEDAEELEEEEEDGDMPPLEGTEDKLVEEDIEEDKVLRPAVDEGGMAGYIVEGETEGGIEELQTSRAVLEDRKKVQEVESIGVLEDERDAEGEEDESEKMDDPTMPQILCVTGGALEEGAGAGSGLQEEMSMWDQDAKEGERTAASGEHVSSQSLQEPDNAMEDAVKDDKPSKNQEEEMVAQVCDSGDADLESSSGQNIKGQEQTGADQGEIKEAEQSTREEKCAAQVEQEGRSVGVDGKGTKRKREDGYTEEDEQSTEKIKPDDDAMASMLADFVACPPDDEDIATGSNSS